MQDLNQKNQPAGKTEEIIAFRKSCDPDGTGLSHYILMDNQPAGKEPK